MVGLSVLVECFGAGVSLGTAPLVVAQRGGSYPEAACHLVLCGLHIGRGAQAVECGPQDWFEVARVAVDRGNGDDHVENLLEGEVVADLVSALRGGEEWTACGDYAGTVVVE